MPDEVRSDAANPEPWGRMPLDQITDADGPYQSRLVLRLSDGTVLHGDDALDYMRRAQSHRGDPSAADRAEIDHHHRMMRSGRSQDHVRADYLRLLGEDVEAALSLIIRDVVATGVMPVEEASSVVRERAREHLESQAELRLKTNAEETAVWVAEAVQEDIIEGRDDRPGLVTWPACPEHPEHPLWLRGDYEELPDGTEKSIRDPAWTCITSERVVAELGKL